MCVVYVKDIDYGDKCLYVLEPIVYELLKPGIKVFILTHKKCKKVLLHNELSVIMTQTP